MISEVEKIWILYDLDDNGTLEYEEICAYIKEMAYPHLELTKTQLWDIFWKIDVNKSGEVDKKEMEVFIYMVMDEQMNLCFKLNDKEAISKIKSLSK